VSRVKGETRGSFCQLFTDTAVGHADDESPNSDEDTTDSFPVTSVQQSGSVTLEVQKAQASSSAGDDSTESGEIPAQAPEAAESRGNRQGRKPLEPYDVPTSGLFWMHDDRLGSDEEEAPR
jgi:CASC3/Barentsz eIF4AIII binding